MVGAEAPVILSEAKDPRDRGLSDAGVATHTHVLRWAQDDGPAVNNA